MIQVWAARQRRGWSSRLQNQRSATRFSVSMKLGSHSNADTGRAAVQKKFPKRVNKILIIIIIILQIGNFSDTLLLEQMNEEEDTTYSYMNVGSAVGPSPDLKHSADSPHTAVAPSCCQSRRYDVCLPSYVDKIT